MFFKIRETLFQEVGRPVGNSYSFGSLTKMLRLFIGITDRKTDITEQNTYQAESIIRVF